MYTYINTYFGPTTSTESTTTSPDISPYVTKTNFATTTKDLFANFYDKFKEYLKETIADQDTKFDAKFEKQTQTLSLHTKEDSTKFSLKLYDQDNKISSSKAHYNERLDNIASTTNSSPRLK